jgi:hypothetical protein
MRIVLPSEGFDYTFRTPVSSAANVVWRNFDGAGDEAGNTLPVFVAVGAEVTFTTRDSIAQDALDTTPRTVLNGGHGPGNGYAVLSWDGLGAGTARDGASDTGIWTRENLVYAVPNESDGNDILRVEFWAQMDEGVQVVDGDSIGVSFLGTMIDNPEDFLNGATYRLDVGTGDPSTTKLWRSWAEGVEEFGNSHTLTTAHDLGTGDWKQVIARWRVPSRPSHIRINIWKGVNTTEDAMRISDLYITWVKQ